MDLVGVALYQDDLTLASDRIRACPPENPLAFPDAMDVVTRAVRSRMMSGIRGGDTRPELIVRTQLHRAGFRFRLRSRVHGVRPDLVLTRWNVVVFVHGCFWHRHANCRYAYEPKSKRRFWISKFSENISRDFKQHKLLREAGWRVLTIWECGLRTEKLRERTITAAVRWIRSRSTHHELP